MALGAITIQNLNPSATQDGVAGAIGTLKAVAVNVVGDLLKRAKGGQYPVLTTALVHLRTYEARRKREGKG